MTPIEQMLDAVPWVETNAPKTDGLYATHSGVFEIMGSKLRCYRLNNGQAVFHADDFEKFFEDILESGGQHD